MRNGVACDLIAQRIHVICDLLAQIFRRTAQAQQASVSSSRVFTSAVMDTLLLRLRNDAGICRLQLQRLPVVHPSLRCAAEQRLLACLQGQLEQWMLFLTGPFLERTLSGLEWHLRVWEPGEVRCRKFRQSAWVTDGALSPSVRPGCESRREAAIVCSHASQSTPETRRPPMESAACLSPVDPLLFSVLFHA